LRQRKKLYAKCKLTPGELAVSFTYTPTGRYPTSTAADGTVYYAYEVLDRLTNETMPEGTLRHVSGKLERGRSIHSKERGRRRLFLKKKPWREPAGATRQNFFF
jgi:hypothetical protein